MRRKFGFNKKICTKLLIVYVYFQPKSCNTHAEHEWAQGTFLRQWRKVPPAMHSGCLVRAEMPSTWRADLLSYSCQKIYLTKNGGQIWPGAPIHEILTEAAPT
jgi:hypothetical protein